MWREALRRWAHDHQGQSLAELSLGLPVLVFCLIGGGDIARAYAVQLAVQNGARAGAEGAALQATPTQTDAQNWAKQEMSNTPGLIPTSATITLTLTNGSGGACAASPPTLANPCFATVRVQYTFTTLIPWPFLPNTFTFDRSTTMRKFS